MFITFEINVFVIVMKVCFLSLIYYLSNYIILEDIISSIISIYYFFISQFRYFTSLSQMHHPHLTVIPGHDTRQKPLWACVPSCIHPHIAFDYFSSNLTSPCCPNPNVVHCARSNPNYFVNQQLASSELFVEGFALPQLN